MSQLTVLLERLKKGDNDAREALFAAAYAELHHLAQARLRISGPKRVIDTTSLVHESYLRFVDAKELRSEDRRAFFDYASHVMRSVIVDTARDQMAKKRGGGAVPVTLSTEIAANLTSDEETVIKVHEALDTLERADKRLAKVAQMRYFGGYSDAEIAETLQVNARTVRRDWEKARLILAAALR